MRKRGEKGANIKSAPLVEIAGMLQRESDEK
jgi:hypothetical protein